MLSRPEPKRKSFTLITLTAAPFPEGSISDKDSRGQKGGAGEEETLAQFTLAALHGSPQPPGFSTPPSSLRFSLTRRSALLKNPHPSTFSHPRPLPAFFSPPNRDPQAFTAASAP